MAVPPVEARDRLERLEAVRRRLADPEQEPGRERDPEAARGRDRREPGLGVLTGRALVRLHPRRRLEHQPHARVHLRERTRARPRRAPPRSCAAGARAQSRRGRAGGSSRGRTPRRRLASSAPKPGTSSGRSPKVKRASVQPVRAPSSRTAPASPGRIRHPGPTGRRKPQYAHRFRQTVVSGRKTFRENVTRRRGMYTDGRRHYSSFTVVPASVRQVVRDGPKSVLRYLKYRYAIYILLQYFRPICPIIRDYSLFSRKLLIRASVGLSSLQWVRRPATPWPLPARPVAVTTGGMHHSRDHPRIRGPPAAAAEESVPPRGGPSRSRRVLRPGQPRNPGTGRGPLLRPGHAHRPREPRRRPPVRLLVLGDADRAARALATGYARALRPGRAPPQRRGARPDLLPLGRIPLP